MAWSIMRDLIHLNTASTVIPTRAVTERDCKVQAIAQRLRRCVDVGDNIIEPDNQNFKRQFTQRHLDLEGTLLQAASYERANSITGAVFQIGVALGAADVIAHKAGIRCSTGGITIPDDVAEYRDRIGRLLGSAVTAILRITGVPGEDALADYFFSGLDPLGELGVPWIEDGEYGPHV